LLGRSKSRKFGGSAESPADSHYVVCFQLIKKLPRPEVTFGITVALPEYVTQLREKRKEKPDESQDEHEGWQRSMGWLILEA
jgi:hypothetical protein